jgi:hypothetical protein
MGYSMDLKIGRARVGMGVLNSMIVDTRMEGTTNMKRVMVGREKLQNMIVSSTINTPIVDAREVHALPTLHLKLMQNTKQREGSFAIRRWSGEIVEVHDNEGMQKVNAAIYENQTHLMFSLSRSHKTSMQIFVL